MILIFAIIVGVISLDQLTKWLAVIYLKGEASFPLWQDVLHFTYAENRGMAFGMLEDHRWVFMVLSTVGILAILFYLLRFRPASLWMRISLSMIVGGGIGNMIDRVILGYVVDFIDFTLIDFAIFNVADSFVCVGAGMTILYLIYDIVREARTQKQAEAQPTPTEEDPASDETPAENRDDES